MGEERRRAARIKKELFAQYRELSETAKWDMAEVADLSEVGLVIRTEKVFPPDTALRLRMKMPLNPFQCYEFDGKVVGCAKHKVRIEITDINPEAQGLIRQYVEWYLSKK